MGSASIREAVGVFEDEQSLDAAISELENTAFPRQDISVLSWNRDVAKRFGTARVDSSKLQDNPSTPRGIPIMPEEKAIGAGLIISGLAYVGGCAAAIAANAMPDMTLLYAITAGSVAGALAGIVIVLILRALYKKNIARQIKKGGLIVWVRTPEPDLEKTACAILQKHGGQNIHIHDIR